MIALLFAVLPLLAAPSPAQDSPEQASQSIRAEFEKLTSPRAALTLPSYAEVQRQRLQDDLKRPYSPSRFSGGGASISPTIGRNAQAQYRWMGVTRHITRSIEVFPIHPSGRVDIGAGWSDRRDWNNNAYFNHDIARYGVIRFNLGRSSDKKSKTLEPAGTYSETEVSPKPLSSRSDYDYRRVRGMIKNAAQP